MGCIDLYNQILKSGYHVNKGRVFAFSRFRTSRHYEEKNIGSLVAVTDTKFDQQISLGKNNYFLIIIC